ncbi:MAG TPA: glycosyltransferase [Pyrinomonadaceae bacterium]|nr:glycosyltransferase [Pyrinomonadaceae bacterium]
MKLIVSPLGALRGYVSREFFHVIKELIEKYGWRQMETRSLRDGRRTMKELLLREFGELPEVILFWEGYDTLTLNAVSLRQLDCRKYILADDLHWSGELMRQRKLVCFAFCHAVLSTYGYAWGKFYPALAGVKRVVWVPHSASPDFMIPYNAEPENSVLLSGAVSVHYPLRRQMKSLHERGVRGIAYHPHPGYHCRHDYQREDGDVGRGYALRINRHRAAFTDSLSFNYVVAKYFEIPATGALLLADDSVSGPLESLGFVKDLHYVPVSEENLEERIRYVLDERNRSEVDEIRRRGQELVWARHKTSDRARQIDGVCAG